MFTCPCEVFFYWFTLSGFAYTGTAHVSSALTYFCVGHFLSVIDKFIEFLCFHLNTRNWTFCSYLERRELPHIDAKSHPIFGDSSYVIAQIFWVFY